MAAYGRTVRIYLADGTPSGIRHAELVNWVGQAVVCPRARVGELSKWPESNRPGVYILIGEDPDSVRRMAYIGEAENVRKRLRDHVAKKDFWDQVVFFSSKDDNLTKSHVKYLESRMLSLAKQAKRARLDNANVPAAAALPRSDRDAMEEFLGPARILLGALGFNLLEPVRVRRSEVAHELEPVGDTAGPLADIKLHFEVARRGVKAEGYSTDEGFVVLAGAVGPLATKGSLIGGWRQLRQSLIEDGRIGVDGDTIRFTEDVLFSSPSAAAANVCGGVWNGRQGWKDSTGSTLADLEEALIAAAEVAT